MPSKKSNRKRREDKAGSDMLSVMLKAFAVGILSLFVFLTLVSFSVISADASKSLYPVFALVCVGLSAFVGGFYAARRLRKRGLAVGALSQLGTVVLVTVISLIINRSLGLSILLLPAATVIFGGLGGLAAVNLRLRRR